LKLKGSNESVEKFAPARNIAGSFGLPGLRLPAGSWYDLKQRKKAILGRASRLPHEIEDN
jgi:hypothetical protein